MSQPPVPPVGVPTCYRHPDRETYISCQRCGRPICPDCMREAAVGFHCPTCVAEGAKQTRQARTAYGGKRSTQPALTTMVLIATNAAVWLAILATGGPGSRLVDLLGLRPNGACQIDVSLYEIARSTCERGGVYLPGVVDGGYWQLLTSAFTHVQLWHIGFNMLALWVLGPQLEVMLGRARFLALYLVSALAGSTLVYWAAGQYQLTVGASGAIFGLLGGLLVVALKIRGDVRGLLVWLGLNAVITVLVPNVSWQGHLGGFLGGLVVAAILVYAPRDRRALLQWSGVALVTVALLAAIFARTLVLG